jgi:hypothetical protein
VQEVGPDVNESKSVAGLFFNASLGTLTLEPDADGDGAQDVFHVSIDDSYIGGDAAQCDPSGWVTKASAAWQSANPGKNIGLYRHRLLITPNYWDNGNRHCGWGGVAQVGCGTWCWAIGADPDSIMHGVIVHELGHNFGLNHARKDQNNNGYNSAETATDSEYGDNSDMMGSSRNWKKFNPPHAEDKGWIDPADYEIRAVVAGASPQLFDLLPLDDEAWDWPGLRALKLERSANSDYYVTFRRASGEYNNLDSPYADKLNIYYGQDNSTYSYFVTALAAGQNFTDTARNLVITAPSPVALSEGGRSTVAMGVQVCQQGCSTTPAPSGWARPRRRPTPSCWNGRTTPPTRTASTSSVPRWRRVVRPAPPSRRAPPTISTSGWRRARNTSIASAPRPHPAIPAGQTSPAPARSDCRRSPISAS